ncbi:hypothetical protein J1N35_004204 [Gossypium stocksii]|uniref:Uncharacterized protein n=1 Tax=Gossypium stocksii TaxID=47602 RepID=A0A9D3WB64_9ROSI|nr:hypothetical protein J1N35_004204 [Gossypium stocksii]
MEAQIKFVNSNSELKAPKWPIILEMKAVNLFKGMHYPFDSTQRMVITLGCKENKG